MPLWPQLDEVLRGYLFAGGDAREGLLFPGNTASGLLGDIRKVLDQLAARAGFLRPVLDPATGRQKKTRAGQFEWTGQHIRAHMLRHTYCAARLQTLDRGQPVSEYTVAKELGHGGPDLVRCIYGHLGAVRHRAEVVEYRMEQHRSILGDHADLITQSDTETDTAATETRVSS